VFFVPPSFRRRRSIQDEEDGGKKNSNTQGFNQKHITNRGGGGWKIEIPGENKQTNKKKNKKNRKFFPSSFSFFDLNSSGNQKGLCFFLFFLLKLMLWFLISSLALALGGASAALPTIPADGRGAAGTGFVRLTTAAYPGGGNGDVMRGGTEPAGVGYVEEI
jgi:hypothetical protein